ncbi:uncharacterized protein LOC120351072 [Nilaparvata lugens]|uniref:uncharacterized protein LOC120351072 n=1 Tax=Nilaparvata lugens TaxID=108931 RepID=UPI00193D4CB7|nr:uncharacterized protein LOC120351072 [Nilaparvata lugens]
MLTLMKTFFSDNGIYVCQAENELGSSSDSTTVSVLGKSTLSVKSPTPQDSGAYTCEARNDVSKDAVPMSSTIEHLVGHPLDCVDPLRSSLANRDLNPPVR